MWNIDLFVRTLAKQGLAATTIASYRLHVERFVEWCAAEGIPGIRSVTDSVVERYIETKIDKRAVSSGWKYAEKRALRRYFVILEQHDEVLAAPIVHARKPKHPSGGYRAIDCEQLQTVLDSFPTDTDSDLLAKSILETGYSAALRPGELRRLQVEDIDFPSGRLFLSQSKGRKDRIVPIGEVALFWLKRYLTEARPRYVANSAERIVFIAPRSRKAFTHRAIGEFIRYRLVKHGFPRFSLHQLRASAATHMVESGMDIAWVQRILGHSELKTTQRYVQLELRDIAVKLASFHSRTYETVRRKIS